MEYVYNVGVHSRTGESDYYEENNLAFKNPVNKGDFVLINDMEMEVFQIIHMVNGPSKLHVYGLSSDESGR